MKQQIIYLDQKSIGPLIVLLNIELRNKLLSLDHAKAYNQLFSQLRDDDGIPCGDHESMEWRNKK